MTLLGPCVCGRPRQEHLGYVGKRIVREGAVLCAGYRSAAAEAAPTVEAEAHALRVPVWTCGCGARVVGRSPDGSGRCGGCLLREAIA